MSKHVTEHISKLREDFLKGTLDVNDVNKDPHVQLELWFKQALDAAIPEAQAMTLSTVVDNKPSSRIVYLRELDDDKLFFYGNLNSRKAQDMQKNPNVSLNFFWAPLERQIRLEGTVMLAADKYNDNYFNNRPYESKLGAWASEQSARLNSRKDLDDRVELFRKQYEGKEITRPPYWGGWVFTPNYYEFWQGRKSRLHDRICYELKDGRWEIFRLAP